MEKISQIVNSEWFKMNPGFGHGIHEWCDPGLARFFSIFSTFQESLRAPDPALPRVRSSPRRLHPRRLGSEALRLLQHRGKLFRVIQ